MNEVNKTLYIPLYGKSFVSKKGLFIQDKMAEEIWDAEGFTLKGKSRSKWLAYYMGIRSATFDDWTREQMSAMPDSVVLHIGCGLDSRAMRVGCDRHMWYDVDFPQVIDERKKYFTESQNYKMLGADASGDKWLGEIVAGSAIVVMEGVSMYLSPDKIGMLLTNLSSHFKKVALLVDCYTDMAARLTKYKNPINDVGVTTVWGLDDPAALQIGGLKFVSEHSMTPDRYIDQLKGAERSIFKKLYAGPFSKKLYRLYEYKKDC